MTPIRRTYFVGTDPGPTFVGDFNGQTDLVTVNAGSNDLTLISDFDGAGFGNHHDLIGGSRSGDSLRNSAPIPASTTWSSATPATACWRSSREVLRA